jgi:predicted P-loop ATPase
VILPLLRFIMCRRCYFSGLKTTDGEHQFFVKDIWRNFNIKSVIHNIGNIWAEVLQSYVNGVLRNV